MIAIGNAVGLLIFLTGQWFPNENYFGSLGMVIFFLSLAVLAFFDVLVFIVVVSRQSPTPKYQPIFNTSPRQESVLWCKLLLGSFPRGKFNDITKTPANT